MNNPNTFEALEKRWRDNRHGYNTGCECPACLTSIRRADELAALAPHYVHKDKLRELRDKMLDDCECVYWADELTALLEEAGK